jgi:hypothetical protein
MLAKLVSAGDIFSISFPTAYCTNGYSPANGACMGGGLPYGGCRNGGIPATGGICKMGGTSVDI